MLLTLSFSESFPWLASPPLSRLLAILNDNRFETRVVGGAVRNSLLGLPVGDIDLATTALPVDVMAAANLAGFKVVPTGVEHGTVTVVVDGQPFEVTTLRQDVLTDGRRANVVFGHDWATDAQRRDLTINALFLDRHGSLHDFVGGLDDLTHRRIRFIGDPDKRVQEDHLRILRFFRFAAAYGHQALDTRSIAACFAHLQGLRQLSRERIRQELWKILLIDRGGFVLKTMAEGGVLSAVSGSVPRVHSWCRMVDLENGLGLAPLAVRRFAAMFYWGGADCDRFKSVFRLTRSEDRFLQNLSVFLDDFCCVPQDIVDPLMMRLKAIEQGRDVIFEGALLYAVLSSSNSDKLVESLRAFQALDVPERPFKGRDFLQRGVTEKRVGEALRLAMRLWLERGACASSDHVTALLDEVAAFIKANEPSAGETRE